MSTLQDVGEFALLDGIVFPTLAKARGPIELGDDCAALSIPNDIDTLVLTSDVAPIPLVFSLGFQSYETFGWYAVTVNVSDLAAGGARPLAFQMSVEAPPQMAVDDFEAFFRGIADACEFYGIYSSGGNIRSAPRFACHGTAIGVSRSGRFFTRKGLEAGDLVLSIGYPGVFMAAALSVALGGRHLSDLDTNLVDCLVRPVAKIREALALADAGVVKAAADNSDGLLMSLFHLAERSNVDIVVDVESLAVPEPVKQTSSQLRCNPLNLVMAWGDYNLIVGVEPKSLELAQSILRVVPAPIAFLGEVIPGTGKVWSKTTDATRRFRKIGNENFARSSYNDTPTLDLLREIAYAELLHA